MISILLPVSRPNFLRQVFTQLELLDLGGHEVSLFVYVDGDLQLFEKAQSWLVNSKFSNKRIVYRRKGLPNVSHIRSRRQRIADIHNELKEYLEEQSAYVLSIEDDTLFPADGLVRLLDGYKEHPSAGFISGVQIGRWGFDHVGAWKMEKNTITSLPVLEGLQEVTAAGLYFCLVKSEVYKSGVFVPFEDILGPDFTFGLVLTRLGYKNYVDFEVKCTHLTNKESIGFDNREVIQVGFVKEENHWLLQGEL